MDASYYQAVGCQNIDACLRFGSCFCWDNLALTPESSERIHTYVLSQGSVQSARAQFVRTYQSDHPHPERPPLVQGIQGIKSVYELTLTTPDDDPLPLRRFLDRVVSSKMFGVLAFTACFELTKNGMPHIHAMLWSSKNLLNSNHIRVKMGYPHRFTLSKVRMETNYWDYIHKDCDNPETQAYCAKHDLEQIWGGVLISI